MATFRKPASKTRAALESSTAIPPVGSDVLDHVGEQAAKIAAPVKPTKTGRKAASKPPIPADAGLALAVPDLAIPETAPGVVDPVAPVADIYASAAGSFADTADAVADIRTEAAEAALDATRATDDLMAEVESVTADLAEQASHAGADAVKTATQLSTETVAETVARTAEITATLPGAATSFVDAAASAIDRANAVEPDGAPTQALSEFNARLADLFREYLEDSLAFMAAITTVRSVPEALTVNQQHFQRRLNAISAQSRDLTLLAGKLTAQAWRPFTPAAFR